MQQSFNPKYPSVEDLAKRARMRIPKFAFEYLDGGCNEEINLYRNTSDIRKLELLPQYLKVHRQTDLKTELFGRIYDAPFGIAPIGLQGLIWPNAPEILAKAAFENNLPFVLSTVSTSSIERIGEITEGNAWFQLYHPAERRLRDDLMKRASQHCSVLVILSDVPTFGYRPKEIKNGLAMPPRMTMNNVLQILTKPNWAMKTLIHGQPSFEVLKPYMPKGMDMHHLGLFMNKTFDGRLNEQKVSEIREMWKGKLVLKGIVNEIDVAKCISLGIDGIIVSNHGGRQLDAGESAIQSLDRIVKKYSGQIKIMMDSGIRSGTDIARTLAAGAEFTFLGRTFMYGVGALGDEGGHHTISILKRQLKQVMDQLCCQKVNDLSQYLLPKNSRW